MEVILDTNILFGDWMLHRADAKAFLAYVERTGSIVYIPKIVWEETRKNYRQELATNHSNYERASKQFGRTMVEQPELKIIKLDYEQEVERYLKWLREKLRFNELKNILPYGDFTERIAQRAMTGRRPFNGQNNKEYKDCLVWETALDVLSSKTGRDDEEVVLISNDSNAFGAGKVPTGKPQVRGEKVPKQVGVLHPELQEETDAAVAENKKTFYYYESFAAFLADHYTPIEGIDAESVKQYLSQGESGFQQLLQKELAVRTPAIISSLQATYNTVSLSLGAFTIKSISPIQDFYVYSSQKGQKISASGNISVYLKTTASHKYRGDKQPVEVDLYPVADIKFTLVYTDRQPSSLFFESFILPIGAGMRLPEQPKPKFKTWFDGSEGSRPVSTYDLSRKVLDNLYTLEERVSKPFTKFTTAQTIFNEFYTLEERINDPLRNINLDTLLDNLLVNQPYEGDTWRIREASSPKFESSSKFLPKRGEKTPVPKNIPSKRKKKGAKKR